MPRYMIRFPNERGHCFIISALLPLLHSTPFIQFLNRVHVGYSLRYLCGEVSDSNRRFRTEVTYFWTGLLFKLYQTYRNIAYLHDSTNSMKVLNVRRLKVGPKQRVIGYLNEIPAKLVLDHSLFYDLVDSLSRYSSKIKAEGGGDERVMYRYLISKLSSEFPELLDVVAVRFAASLTCSSCSGIFNGKYATPFGLHPIMTFSLF